jgi:AmmeMemoRadiSam system protein B
VLQYNTEKDAETLVKEAVQYMELPDADLGEVISFEAVSTKNAIFLTSLSKPKREDAVRKTAVAGAFYPASVAEMNTELDRMLGGNSVSGGALARADDVSAVLVPHAGWFYSGRLAAQVFASVPIPKRLVIFCPQHRHSGGIDWAVAPNVTWQLPGQNVETDMPFADAMTNAVRLFSFDPRPHVQEHAIEVQLPILARLAPQTKVVGVAMASKSWQHIQDGAQELAAFLSRRNGERAAEMPLFVISSDMNHYADEETTRQIDRSVLDVINEAVADKKPENVLKFVNENQISMCGIYPAVFVMETLRLLDRLNGVREIGYTTSYESGGDKHRVVGYAGLVFV